MIDSTVAKKISGVFDSLVPFGTYSAVNTIITLSKPYTNYNILAIRCGSNTSYNSGGVKTVYIPTFLAVTTGQSFEISYILNGSLMSMMISFTSTTQCKIVSREVIIGTAWESGIREIFGIK